MPAEVRSKMEAAFGADFSPVRIHQGLHAEAVGALAYTRGTDIHFAPGQYQPRSPRGQELLGHELTHVVQQAQGRGRGAMQAKGVKIDDDPMLEREADEMGARAARGEGGQAPWPVAGEAHTPPTAGSELRDDGVAQQLTKRFGSFLAARILHGEMTTAEAARALRLYRGTQAGRRDLFFHDNAVAALVAKKKLEASNIGVEGYQALAAAPELLASGRYKFHPNYRKTVEEQLEEQLAEATLKARESGLAVLRLVYRDKGPMAALDAAKEIASFSDDPAAAVNLIIQEEQQRNEAVKRSDLLRQAKYLCKKEMIATDEMCDDFFDNLSQEATVGVEGEIEFSTASLSAAPAKDWQLNEQERANRESLLSPEEKADREAVRDARAELFRIDALEGAGTAISTGFYDLFVGMPGDLVTYGVNSLFDANHAYRSTFGRELSAEFAKGEGTDIDRIKAELAKGDAADMDVIQREMDKGHFNAAQLDTLDYELRRADRDFRKIQRLLEEGKGTDYWKVADIVGKTAVDIGETVLSLLPGAQGAGVMGKMARIANVVGDMLFIYDTLSSAKVGVEAALSGDGRAFGQSFGGMLQVPLLKYGGSALVQGLKAGTGLARNLWTSWREQGGAPIDFGDPAMRAARSSGSTGPSWSQMSLWQRFTTALRGPNAIEGARALDFDVDAAVDRVWSNMFGDQYIGQLSKADQAAIAAGMTLPPPYIHSVRLGNAIEFASFINAYVLGQLLTHILFENQDATFNVGAGGHGSPRGDSFIVDKSARDARFLAADERVAREVGATANIWDLADPDALKTWLKHREAAKQVSPGAAGWYAIASWCWSAYTGANKKGPVRPLTDWDARFDAWNEAQRRAGAPSAIAARKSDGGGLYMGSDVRAKLVAEIEAAADILKVLKAPGEWLKRLYGIRAPK